MAQQPVENIATPPASDSSNGDHVTRPSAELRVERSRFSRLLARFGLGELTDPILRPTKSPAGRSSAG
jgi:hypothetical protein